MPKEDTQFKKGQSGNPAGRPEGSKDRHFVRVEFWLGRYFEMLEQLPLEQRIPKCEGVLEKFFSKIGSIAATPEESKAAGISALDELKAAEEYGINRSAGTPAPEPGSNGAHVGNGSPQS